ncbi:MAG: class I SAM-dependent methyltransferase [Acidimicrobiia bacterium]
MDASMWNDRYDGTELLWSAGPNQFLPPLVADLEPGSVLDVACGEGRNSIWLAERGWNVTAVDFSDVAIERGRTLAGDTDINWVVGDVTTLDTADHVFDLVIVFYLHLGPQSFQDALTGALRAVAPGGSIFAVGHAVRNVADGYGGPPYPEILWDAERFENLLDGFEILELGERLRPVADADATAIDFALHAERTAI